MTMASFACYNFALVAILLLGVAVVSGLKCQMCGQYNEGVGSITPCLNYSEKHASSFLRECTRASEKFCVKYVSELSIVRDCATECSEKEVWDTQTYCCTEDGCNGSNPLLKVSFFSSMKILPFLIIIGIYSNTRH